MDTIDLLEEANRKAYAAVGKEMQKNNGKALPSNVIAVVDAAVPMFPIKRAGDTYHEFAETDWLVEGVIEANSLAELFADPETYKSFLAVDMGCCVATGTPWKGMDVKQGGVLFVIGEGLRGFNKRLKAWSHHHGVPLEDAPLFYSETSADFMSVLSAKNVVTAIKDALTHGESVNMVVIDTLARNMSGNESSPEDMALFIGHVDRMVRAELGCTVLVIHHPGVHDKLRGRGTNALRGAVDTDIRLHHPDREGFPNTIVMECMKQKNEERFVPILLDFRIVDWGQESKKGHPITSGVLVPSKHTLKEFGFKDAKLGKRARLALDCLTVEIEKSKGSDRVPNLVWRDSCEFSGITSGTTKPFRKVFSEAKNELEKKRQIQYDPTGKVGIYPLKEVSQ